jgi:hypothetical protein
MHNEPICFKQKGEVSNTILLQVKTDRGIKLSADKAGFGICLRLSPRVGPGYVGIEEQLITLLVHGPVCGGVKFSADRAEVGICLRLSLRVRKEYVGFAKQLTILLVHGPL